MIDKIIKQNGVIWVDKLGFSVYIDGKSFIRSNFTPELFNNLEIVDKAKLLAVFDSFILQNKLGYLSFILILGADILFERDWPLVQTEPQKQEETDFIESIPFENTLSHHFIKDNKRKVIGANQDIIFLLRDAFKKQYGHLLGAYPYSLFGANIRNETVKETLKNISNFKLDNLYDASKDSPILKSPEEIKKEKKTDKSLVPVLIIIFVVLVGLLSFLVMRK